MNEQTEDTLSRVQTYSKAIQKAWNLMSMHNSELLLENYELKERIRKMHDIGFLQVLKWKLQKLLRSDYE